MMKIKNVSMIPGCISCGTCEVICSKVFTVKDIAYVNDHVDPNEHQDDVEEAADMCPVSVIKVEHEQK